MKAGVKHQSINKNKKYNTIGTVPIDKSQKEAKSIPLYTAAHFLALVQAPIKREGGKLFV